MKNFSPANVSWNGGSDYGTSFSGAKSVYFGGDHRDSITVITEGT